MIQLTKFCEESMVKITMTERRNGDDSFDSVGNYDGLMMRRPVGDRYVFVSSGSCNQQ